MNKLEGIIRRVGWKEMCALFNEGQYWDRMRNGEFTPVLLEDRHPSVMKADEPFCTQSQSISYRDSEDREVVRVHQYLRPDKTLGASGRPDPKRLYQNGVWYRLIGKSEGASEQEPGGEN
jgi:hypothetical protein